MNTRRDVPGPRPGTFGSISDGPGRFRDRRDAGRRLIQRLRAFRGPEVVILALSPGGAAVAHEIATGLRVRLDMVTDEHARPYRGLRGSFCLAGCTVVLVDDVLIDAEAAEMACRTAYRHGAVRVVAAVAVATQTAIDYLAAVVDNVVCLDTPARLDLRDAGYGGAAAADTHELVEQTAAQA
jgi:putative phosphoribosyl transferase